MASLICSPFPVWTSLEDLMLEFALVMYPDDTPGRWEKVARVMGVIGSAEEMKRHYYHRRVEDCNACLVASS
uniref:Myb-like domain-containing protein n=1 Tax=Kalanchoe fedtschenkoi TaxID=63787 RepID=A0A7N0V4M6_KALFE